MKKIILIVILIGNLFSQEIAYNFYLPELTLKENKGLDISVVRKYFWGSTTYMADSTNYVSLVGKGLYVPDSAKVGGWLFAGTKNGGIYLDTNRLGQIFYTGNSLYFYNRKTNGYLYFYGGELISGFSFNKFSGGATLEIASLDTILGYKQYYGNIQVSGTTQQVKMAGDTASDYDSDDAITLNQQTGTLTTKTLTTGTNTDYNLTFSNSLISNNTRIFAIVNAYTGTGLPIVRKVTSGASSATITIRNIDGAAALNAAVLLSVFLSNSP